MSNAESVELAEFKPGRKVEKCRECISWARVNMPLFTTHHRSCNAWGAETEAQEIIANVLYGVEAWANDEDGVHGECILSYKDARQWLWNNGRSDLLTSTRPGTESL